MNTSNLPQLLNQLLANTYALYIKTQNYHWHVRGSNFYSLHKFLESQYEELGEAIDEIAEHIVSMGYRAVASFSQLDELSTLSAGRSELSSEEMLSDLLADHHQILQQLKNTLLQIAEDDGATDNLLSDRMQEHQKMAWMLAVSIEH